MQKRFVLFLFLSLSFLGCKTDTSEEVIPTYFIDLEQEDIGFMLKEASDIKVIPLSTTEESVINKMTNDLEVFNDKFYILDQNEFAFLIFSKDGSFIKKVKNIGRGPGEYSRLSDMEINPFTNNLDLLSPDGKLCTYNIAEESFETTALLSDVASVHYFANVSEDLVIFYSVYEDHQLFLYSKSQEKILWKALENIDKSGKVKMSLYISPFQRFGQVLKFIDPFTKTVYNISNEDGELSKQFTLDFGKYNVNVDELPDGMENDPLAFKTYLEEKSKAFSLFNYYENDQYIWATTHLNQKVKSFIIDKRTEEYNLYYVPLLYYFAPLIHHKDETNMMGYIYYKNNYSDVFDGINLDIEQKSLLTNISSNDNPILVKYDLSKILK